MTEPFRILFVCTGNTCRSPMAEAIARKRLRRRGWKHVEVASAGVSALTGVPASDGAVAAAQREGLDLSDHSSSQLTRERLEAADLVLAMTPGHVRAVEELGGSGKVALLGAFAAGDEAEGRGGLSVPDPFGGGELEYTETFRTLQTLVERTLDRLEPVVAP